MPNVRKQFNIAYALDSPAVTLIEQAERATGQPASKIVKQVVDAYLSTWLWEEMERSRQRDEANQRAQEGLAKRLDEIAATQDNSVPLRQVGKQRPRYRGEDGIQPGFAEAVDMRVPVSRKVVARYENVPIRLVERRAPSRQVPVVMSLDAETDDD